MAWLALGSSAWQTGIGVVYEKGSVLGMVGIYKEDMVPILKSSELNAGGTHALWDVGSDEMTAQSRELWRTGARETNAHQIRQLQVKSQR